MSVDNQKMCILYIMSYMKVKTYVKIWINKFSTYREFIKILFYKVAYTF